MYKPITNRKRLKYTKDLKSVIHDSDMTVLEIARKTGISRSAIYNFINHENGMYREHAEAFFEVLNLEIDDWVY